MKDLQLEMFYFLLITFTEQPPSQTNPSMIQQVVNGLLSTTQLLPEHVQMELHTSLLIFAARLKLKEIILISITAIVQPTFRIDQATTPSLRRHLRRLLTLVTQVQSS